MIFYMIFLKRNIKCELSKAGPSARNEKSAEFCDMSLSALLQDAEGDKGDSEEA